ncbi:MAG TPA: lytic murein transglycosylase B [Burkholderiales bacterium]|nr:lytic murein transglycosylase B [Burkholderiales bacterium]
MRCAHLVRYFTLAALAAAALAAETAFAQRELAPEIETFINEISHKHGFDRAALRRVFSQVRPRAAVIRAVMAPATARPWHEFRARLLDAARIQGGVRFWREHAATLERASREFGVPEEIIVATIGLETMFGRNTGSFRVLEALTTLAFHYPPRAELFRSELEEYLLLARETGFDMASAKGSYAGAMGIPQFLPSSYRRFALDYDGDGRRDLWGTPQDAIGSVAHYYRAHGWRPGEIVIAPADIGESDADAVMASGIEPRITVAELRRLGVVPLAPVQETLAAALIMAETESGPRYWLAFNNFYVITRYNRSVNYALAVHELARELRALVKPGG